MADLSCDFTVPQLFFEISARGMITKENKERLKSFCLKCCEARNADLKGLIMTCSWSSPTPLLVQTFFQSHAMQLDGDFLVRWSDRCLRRFKDILKIIRHQ